MKLFLASILAFAALARSDSQVSFNQPAYKGKDEQYCYHPIRRSHAPGGDQLLSLRCSNGLGIVSLRSAPIFLALLAMGSFKVSPDLILLW